MATYDEANFYTLNTLYNLISISEYSPKFLLGIINSNLGIWFWLQKNSDFKTLFPKIKKSEIEAIPICKIDFSNKQKYNQYNEIIKNVEFMLSMGEEKQVTVLPGKVEQIHSRIEYIEQRINEIVYQLYGLTEEEIKIVEEAS